jgi:hypothetical protein
MNVSRSTKRLAKTRGARFAAQRLASGGGPAFVGH